MHEMIFCAIKKLQILRPENNAFNFDDIVQNRSGEANTTQSARAI